MVFLFSTSTLIVVEQALQSLRFRAIFRGLEGKLTRPPANTSERAERAPVGRATRAAETALLTRLSHLFICPVERQIGSALAGCAH